MRNRPPSSSRSAEEGFALIEVMVSALVIVLVGAAVMSTLQSTARSAGDSRARGSAQAIAQEDQARLRSMRISSLNKLNQQWTVQLNGTTFTVTSTGAFVNNKTGTPSCTDGNTSADYVKVTSSVTWPGLSGRPPVRMESIVSPSNGSLNPGNGTLTVSTINAAAEPLPGVGLAGSGAGTFSGTTDSAGCANFADLPAGNYTLTPTAAGMVDKDGKAPSAKTVGVVASGTQTAVFQYDRPGALEATFRYRVGSSGTYATAKAASIVAFNSGMTTARTFSSGSSPASAIKTSGTLFPFSSPYAVYAGSCTANNPNPESKEGAPGAAAITSFTVPPGATAAPSMPVGTVTMPAINVVVKKSGTTQTGANVLVTGTCSYSRTFTTISGGLLPVEERALPWGTYTFCTQASISGTTRRVKVEKAVQNLADATTVELNVTSASESKSC